MHKSNAIHARVGPRWPDVLAQLGAGDLKIGKPGPCPVCAGVDRFTFDNRKGRGDHICRSCGAGDGFELLMKLHGWTFSEARIEVMQAAGIEDESDPKECRDNVTVLNADKEPGRKAKESGNNVPRRADAPLDWSAGAEAIWRKTNALQHSLGEVYLQSRGCVLPPRDSHLRYLPASDVYPPSLCAAITDALTGKPISLHFTRLAVDGRGKAGTDRDKTLLAGHRKRGGVIRLWPDEAVTSGLAVAEGIESALCAAHGYTPVWAAIDAGNLAALPVLGGIETLVVVADHDSAGIKAAEECARRWAPSGCRVRIALPRQQGADAADVVAA